MVDHLMSGENVVRIGIKDVYEIAVRTEAALSRLLDREEARTATMADHESRIRRLEKLAYAVPVTFIAGAIAAIGKLVAG